jgi:hypothetical protein
MFLSHFRAIIAGVIEKQLVEFRPCDLVGLFPPGAKAVLEIELDAFGSAGCHNLAAELRQKCAIEFFPHAQAFECLHAEREKGFTDVKPWKLLALQNDNAPTRARKQGRGCTSSRAAADNRNVVDAVLGHAAHSIGEYLICQPQIKESRAGRQRARGPLD